MGLKKNIIDTFSNNKEITIHRYRSAKTSLIFIGFFFFLNFYFVWAWFYSSFFIRTLGFLYLLLLVSLLFYFYFLIKKLLINNEKVYFNVIIFIILLLIFASLGLPIILDNWFNWILEMVRLYS